MAETIKDGRGDGYQARVTGNHQLRTVSVTLTEVGDASAKGNSYNITRHPQTDTRTVVGPRSPLGATKLALDPRMLAGCSAQDCK